MTWTWWRCSGVMVLTVFAPGLGLSTDGVRAAVARSVALAVWVALPLGGALLIVAPGVLGAVSRGSLVDGRGVVVLAGAAEEAVGRAGAGEGDRPVGRDVVAHLLDRHKRDVPVAEGDVDLLHVP